MGKTVAENVAGLGIFSFSEASRLTGLEPRRVRRWFGADGRSPAFSAEFRSPAGHEALSFLDLIDVLIAGKLRERGVSFQALRRAYKNLQKKFGTEHAFSYRNVWTDGKTVFLQEMLQRGEAKLVDMEHRQLVLTRVVQPYLEEIEYDTRDLANRWKITDGVVIDPALNFGSPTLEDVGISSYILASAVAANGNDVDKVAVWYDIDPQAVRRAVNFERAIAA